MNTIRLEQAAMLLRTTEESVLDIMLECGFNNVSYFNQRFREGLELRLPATDSSTAWL
ncbi:MAG: helix-turn-helix domain-containing protein [Blautia marasmi]